MIQYEQVNIIEINDNRISNHNHKYLQTVPNLILFCMTKKKKDTRIKEAVQR